MSDCVLTSYSVNKCGYGRCNVRRFGRRIYLAHVLVWVDAHDQLPPDDAPCILHSCDNPPCVNLDHLSPGTHAQNMSEMKVRGRARSVSGEWEQCPNGHAFTLENTVVKVRQTGRYAGHVRRRCRICLNAYKRVQYYKQKAA